MDDLINRLRVMVGSDMVPMEKAMKLLLVAVSAIEAAGEDAERYRWLKSQNNEDFSFSVVKNPHFDVYDSAEELDAAIDAAREAE